MAGRARPTLRCLREDLGQPIPHADIPLDEIGHLLLDKATERFADDQTPQERIAAIDCCSRSKSSEGDVAPINSPTLAVVKEMSDAELDALIGEATVDAYGTAR